MMAGPVKNTPHCSHISRGQSIIYFRSLSICTFVEYGAIFHSFFLRWEMLQYSAKKKGTKCVWGWVDVCKTRDKKWPYQPGDWSFQPQNFPAKGKNERLASSFSTAVRFYHSRMSQGLPLKALLGQCPNIPEIRLARRWVWATAPIFECNSWISLTRGFQENTLSQSFK